MTEDNTPIEKLEDVKTQMQEKLTGLGEAPTLEQLQNQVVYMAKAFEVCYSVAEQERQAIIDALLAAQTRAKKLDAKLNESLFGRARWFVKKILLGIGWYEASAEEIQIIHEQNYGAR